MSMYCPVVLFVSLPVSSQSVKRFRVDTGKQERYVGLQQICLILFLSISINSVSYEYQVEFCQNISSYKTN